MSDPTSRLNAALADRYRIERQLGEGGMASVYREGCPLPGRRRVAPAQVQVLHASPDLQPDGRRFAAMNCCGAVRDGPAEGVSPDIVITNGFPDMLARRG